MTPLLLLAALLTAAAEPPGGAAVLRLRPHAVATTRVVRVADLADLIGGPPALREHIARLDVAEVADKDARLTLSGKQVGFRLRLAGLPPESFRIEGESATVTVRFRPVSAEVVVARVRQELLAGLPWAADEVQVTLVQPLTAPLPALADDEELAVRAKMRPGTRPPGRVQMDVQLVVRGEARLSLPLYFEVRPCVAVAVCKRRVEPGREVTEADFFVEQQPVAGNSADLASPATLKGCKARRMLLPGQPIRAADVEDGARQAEGPVLVKARESVKLQVRVGDLSVHALGQALQEGRRGQLIRVQNADSKKVLMARVIGPSLAEVE